MGGHQWRSRTRISEDEQLRRREFEARLRCFTGVVDPCKDDYASVLENALQPVQRLRYGIPAFTSLDAVIRSEYLKRNQEKD
jgi:hypothetical protein